MHLSWETVWYFGWPLSFRKLKGFLTSLWACGATFISTKVGVYLLEIIWEHQIVIALFMISLLYDAGNEKWKVLLLYSKGFKITKISGTIYHTSQLRQWQDHNLKQTKVGTSMFTKPREWRISQCLKITSKLYWRNFIIFFVPSNTRRRFCALSKSAWVFFHTSANLHLVLRHEISNSIDLMIKHAKHKNVPQSNNLRDFCPLCNKKEGFFMKCLKTLSDMLIYKRILYYSLNGILNVSLGFLWHKESWFFFWMPNNKGYLGEIRECKSFSFLWKVEEAV